MYLFTLFESSLSSISRGWPRVRRDVLFCVRWGSGVALLMTASLMSPMAAATFEQDVAFLRKHLEVIVLSEPTGQAQVAVVPAYQGRVMTSTPGARPASVAAGSIMS